MPEERQRRVEKALFHGARLTLENPAYLSVLRSLLDALLVPDLSPRDLTVAALGIKSRRGAAQVLARGDKSGTSRASSSERNTER